MRIFPTVIAVCAGFLVAASTVNADPSTTSRLGWVTNGDVRAAVQVGNTLYIGGSFTRVAPRSGVLGSFFGVSATTGDVTTGLPLVDGTVNAVESDGAGGYYIGGTFTTVGGVPRNRLAHVLSDGTVDPVFAPIVDNGVIFSIRRGTAALFVGGNLLQVNGGPQGSFVALNSTTGASVAWPAFTAAVKTLLVQGETVIAVFDGDTGDGVSAFHQVTGATVWAGSVGGSSIINAAVVAGSRLILGGRFSDFPDVLGVISIDVITGVRDAAWEPDKTFAPGPQFPIPSPVEALAVSGDTLYVGGSFAQFGGQPRAHAAAVTISTATVTAWAPTVDGDIVSLVTSPSGGVFMGGAFTRVNGQLRGDFAEVDAGGTLTAWVTGASWQRGRALVLDNGTLVVGTHHGVSGGGVRTNLAAFDLSTDTLLPWAPAMSDGVWRLAAVGERIFIGAKRLVPVGLQLVDNISAVHAVSGATLPWTPQGATSEGHLLLGAVGSHVYVSFNVTAPHDPVTGRGIRRLDAITGAVDQSWFVAAVNPSRMAVTESALYFDDGPRIWVANAVTGTSSLWAPALTPPISSITGLAIDGRTLYVAVQRSNGTSIAAFDHVSRLPVVGMPQSTPPLQSLGDTIRSIAVVDGQIVLAGTAVVASSPDGQAPLWDPGLGSQLGIPSADALLVTPTDVIVLGYNANTPVPVHGVAVFSRTPSAAPTSLRGTNADSHVTLTWNAPSTAPSGYVLDVGAESGSPAPVSLPTGNSAPSVTGLAGNGTYYVRVRAAGAPAGPASEPTNEIALIVGCTAPPPVPPLRLAAQVNGNNVNITWMAPPFTSVSRYVLEAGSSAGAANIGRFTLPGSQTAVDAPIPNGLYFVRVRAANACGESAPTNDVHFAIGGGATIPPAPTQLTADTNVTGLTVFVKWFPAGGAAGYVLEVGSTPGQSDLAVLPLSTSSLALTGNVPSGLYYLRVRAFNGAGLSPPSTELVLRVIPQ